jgi:putative transposase
LPELLVVPISIAFSHDGTSFRSAFILHYSGLSIKSGMAQKSSLMIFDRHANLKYKYGSRHFWCRGYYVDTVGRNKKAIAEYIKNQLQEDIAADQISFKEYMDPFTGSKESKA